MADDDRSVEETGRPAGDDDGAETEGKRGPLGKWTRRAFIGTGALAGGGLVLGVGGVVFAPNRMRIGPESEGGTGQLTTWIKITPDNDVIVSIPHCEMGQGALTGIAMMMAEELEADWSLVRIEESPPEDHFANGYIVRAFVDETGFSVPGWFQRAFDYASYKAMDVAGMQVTGGSTSTRGTGQYGLRVAGAAAKEMLLQAAAATFDAPLSELTARDSRITHGPSGRSATFGELATLAATMKVPNDPVMKPRDQYRLVGTSQNRHDIPSKVAGAAQYGIDVTLPDMLYAAIAASPVPGGQLSEVDEAPATSMAGVHEVVRLTEAVAVVADGYWQASQALAALTPRFTDDGRGTANTESIYAAHVAALDEKGPGQPSRDAAKTVSVEYRVPYLAHATMEPMSATARIANGRCEVWAGTQDPLNARRTAARAADLDVSDVVMHNQQLGGGFGRRLPFTFDYIEQAVHVAKSVSPRPVKLIWSREEDMQHDYYRPFVVARLRTDLDAEGRPLSWASRFTGSRLADGGAARPPYEIDDIDVSAAAPPVHLRTGSWRSVQYSQHGFFVESFIDELAHEAGRDPVEYRAALLSHEPRHLAALQRAADMADWGGPLAEGRGRGIAIVEAFGTIVAEVAEVSVEADNSIRVHRFDAAVDCGLVVNPQQALAQIQGGITFGLSAALYHEITVRNGAVEQRSFPDYPMIQLSNAPRVNVEFIASDAAIGGLGEPGVPPVAPAVANAVFALTGQRLRTLPLRLA
ncbi:MAG: molybdopterin-dependent oxidoreductase [Gemmatimonadota bacterium]|nr:molybdopterin-dependent oxidoreductase [Gemmatimonadota bacterium]